MQTKLGPALGHLVNWFSCRQHAVLSMTSPRQMKHSQTASQRAEVQPQSHLRLRLKSCMLPR